MWEKKLPKELEGKISGANTGPGKVPVLNSQSGKISLFIEN